jgi:amylosucrase
VTAASDPPPPSPAFAFERRLAAHGPRLNASLRALYGHRPDFDSWLAGLLARLGASAQARPRDLAALDLAREAEPNWFLASDMIGYSAYVDRFGGTLAGLAGRIDYLRDLGVRYLHLLPFWKTRAGDSDGGFAVSDYTAVRPDLGDIADLDGLTEALRAARISLCADLVLNHTADDHPWALAARADDPRYRDYFHIIGDAGQVAAFEAGLAQVFPTTAPGNFTWRDDLAGWVWTTFYPFQWDLNWANPEVFAEMTAVILDLANRGVEAFRLDSAAYLWKRMGTACRGEPETHWVLQALRAAVAIVAPAVMLKSEVIAPVADTALYLDSVEAPECHVTYHSGLMTAGWASLAEGDARMARAVIAQTPEAPAGAGFVTYVRCHDDIGWMSLAPQAGATAEAAQARLKRIADFYTTRRGEGAFARGVAFQTADGGSVHGLNGMAASLVGLETAATPDDEALAIDRLMLLHALALAAGGLPLLYMGDELGQTNDDGFLADPERRHEGRWLHRPVFDELRAAQRHDPATPAGLIAARLAGFIEARRRLPAFEPATAPVLAPGLPEAVLGFWRGGDHLILSNFSRHAQAIDVQALGVAGWRDLLLGGKQPSDFRLGAYGSAWLERGEHER